MLYQSLQKTTASVFQPLCDHYQDTPTRQRGMAQINATRVHTDMQSSSQLIATDAATPRRGIKLQAVVISTIS